MTQYDDEKPLIVLKYIPYQVAFRMALCTTIGGLCLILYYCEFLPWFALIFTISGLNTFIDLAMTKEIRLYHDRIIKLRRLLPKKEVMLKGSKLCVRNDLAKMTVIKSGGTNNFISQQLKRILIYLDSVKPEDAEKMNALLAQISGRDIEYFKTGTFFFAKKFYKEDE